jgi:hypothetical protein
MNESNLQVAVRQGKRLPAAALAAGEAPRALPVTAKLAPAKPDPISQTAGSAPRQSPPARDSGPAVLGLELLETSTLDSSRSVSGGKALGLFEYKVTSVERGSFSGDRIRIAHGIVWNGRSTSIASKQPGWHTSLEVVPISTYSSLEKLPLEDDLPEDRSVPIYVPKLN